MTFQPSASAETLDLRPEQPQDAEAVDGLLDRAFGPGRFTKVSERVREFAAFAPELSFCAWRDGRIVGGVRQWRVRAGDSPLVFLGPLAVDAGARDGGIGGRLVARACEAARAAGEAAILLVGDEAYFARFGFFARGAAGVVMPSPVDQRRVLLRPLREGVTAEGRLRPPATRA